MDEDELCFHYRGFLLMCDPRPVGAGGFQANAVIVRRDGTGGTFFATSPDEVVFISEEAAVSYARDWSTEWVDANV